MKRCYMSHGGPLVERGPSVVDAILGCRCTIPICTSCFIALRNLSRKHPRPTVQCPVCAKLALVPEVQYV